MGIINPQHVGAVLAFHPVCDSVNPNDYRDDNAEQNADFGYQRSNSC
jgi:hypothetical protein